MNSRIVRYLRRGVVPWVIWTAVMAAAASLWIDVGSRGPIIGFAHGVTYRVSPQRPGKIQTIAVQLGQKVKAGQVVATLETKQIDGEIRIAKATSVQIQASIQAAQSKATGQAMSTAHQFAMAGESAKVALVRAQASLQVKRAELAAVKKQRAEQQALLAKGMVVKRDLASLEVRHAALNEAVATARSAVKLLQVQVSSSTMRRKALPTNPVEMAVEPLKAQLEVTANRLKQLRTQREELTLRSPGDGHASIIHMRRGEVAQAGTPVITVVSSVSDRVVACVAEPQALTTRVGHAATLYSRGKSRGAMKGRVVSLGPVVDEVPLRCRRNPRQPAWGRNVVILLDKPEDLVAGQAFVVRLEEGPPSAKKNIRTAAASPAPKKQAAGADPRPMSLPRKLRAGTRFEPSGLVWVPGLKRYLLVSDDTGFKGRNDHAPWLFTMDAQGRVDEDPVVVGGISELNDLEGITADDRGNVYILSSQSYSKKGKRKRSRQVFARLSFKGGRFQIDRKVWLGELLDGASKDRRAELGIESTRQLNIEGLTTSSDGGLLLGLKAPLSADGKAIIWWMKNPDRLLATGSLTDAGLVTWAKVKLTVSADGRPARGGVSELLTLPDGSLVIASTASGIRPARQDGALWYAAKPASATSSMKTLKIRRLRTFEGLKPEGLALTPAPGRVIVAFDTNRSVPSWIELPLPKK